MTFIPTETLKSALIDEGILTDHNALEDRFIPFRLKSSPSPDRQSTPLPRDEEAAPPHEEAIAPQALPQAEVPSIEGIDSPLSEEELPGAEDWTQEDFVERWLKDDYSKDMLLNSLLSTKKIHLVITREERFNPLFQGLEPYQILLELSPEATGLSREKWIAEALKNNNAETVIAALITLEELKDDNRRNPSFKALFAGLDSKIIMQWVSKFDRSEKLPREEIAKSASSTDEEWTKGSFIETSIKKVSQRCAPQALSLDQENSFS